jgi:hypothetical protein
MAWPADAGVTFGDLLKLPAIYQVQEVRFCGGSCIELWVTGPGMPQHSYPPAPVRLLFTAEYRDLENRTEQRVLAAWEHDPGRRWIVIDWREVYMVTAIGTPITKAAAP